jgi:hypothetical protein
VLRFIYPSKKHDASDIIAFSADYISTQLIGKMKTAPPLSALFLSSCSKHGFHSSFNEIISDDGVLASSAFVEWYRIAMSALSGGNSRSNHSSGGERGSYDNRIYTQSKRPYPCKSCCGQPATTTTPISISRSLSNTSPATTSTFTTAKPVQHGGLKMCKWKRYYLPVDKYPNAHCLDGSPPAYRILHSEEHNKHTKWAVFFSPGGWCMDTKDCKERSQKDLGSSKNVSECHKRDAGDYFESMLKGFTVVVVHYCDGGSFAGNKKIDSEDVSMQTPSVYVLLISFIDPGLAPLLRRVQHSNCNTA